MCVYVCVCVSVSVSVQLITAAAAGGARRKEIDFPDLACSAKSAMHAQALRA